MRMTHVRRLMAVLAHPDDESLGFGGTLAKYAAEGVDVFLLTATRGDSGRFRGLAPNDPQHPGQSALGRIRRSRAVARHRGRMWSRNSTIRPGLNRRGPPMKQPFGS